MIVLLLGAVSVVLLIACANIASLLLARASGHLACFERETVAHRRILTLAGIVAALTLIATVLAASYVPSRRTFNVDPLTALRAE